MAEAARDAKVGAALDLAREHRPRDGVQGAMASLASGLLLGANDLMRRAQAPGLPPQLVLQAYRTAARLSDAFVAVSDAIARRQGGGTRQLVRVERVTVAAGANAIIGSVGPANGEGGPRE
jgi:hypothetical protein